VQVQWRAQRKIKPEQERKKKRASGEEKVQEYDYRKSILE
jgi:hypothetical protein